MDIRSAASRLKRYMSSPYIVIPSERILERLSPSQVVPFVKTLDTLLGNLKIETESSRESQNRHYERVDPDEGVRKIVINCKRRGMSNEEVHKYSKLKSVDSKSIGAFLAHYTRGTYDQK